MRTLKLTLAYDGTNYCGWQVQPNQPTVQQALEAALERVLRHPTRVVASGRTDSGVHALAQIVSFGTERDIDCDALVRAINAELPRDIAVLDACDAPTGFHALSDAIGKCYRYVIHDAPLRDVFHERYAWHVRERLDVDAMHAAAQVWLGTHDFASFETAGSPRDSTIRTVGDVSVRRVAASCAAPHTTARLIHFEVAADGFLYNMVRAMAGTLVEIGRGARPVGWAADVLAAADRSAAGPTAPAQGLFLVSVSYAAARQPAVNKLGSAG